MAAVLIGLSSCASTKNAATLTDIDGEWNIIELNGTAVVPAPGQEFPFIGFDTKAGRLHGNAGCNRMMGSFDTSLKPGLISLGQAGTTRMMCQDMTLENNVLNTLKQVKKYVKLDDGSMALCGKSAKRLLMVLKKRQGDAAMTLAELGGKWKIVKANGMPVPDGMEKQPFIELDIAARKVHGCAGCNLVNGGFETEEGKASSISFPQLISTMMMCPDMNIESQILKALNSAKSFGKLDNGSVALYDENETVVMELVKE